MGEVNIKDVQQKLYERLKPSGWGDKLRQFITSADFAVLLQDLLTQVTSGKKFTPVLKEVFRNLEECPYSELKVVMICEGPYSAAGLADGIALSSSQEDGAQEPLINIFKNIEETVYPDGYKWDPDLARWANQGILMLNTSFTTTVDGDGHEELWKPFMLNLLQILAECNPGLCYVFVGRHAKVWAKSVPGNNFKFFTMDPTGSGWDGGNVFNQLNIILKQNYGSEIVW
jgi:uracil-DNA glycosylase